MADVDLEALTENMAEALIAHVPGATRASDGAIHLPVASLTAKVLVRQVWDSGVVQQHVWLTGGPLGGRFIEDNFAGFGDSPVDAVVKGVHNWVEGNYRAVSRAFGVGDATAILDIDGLPHKVYLSPVSARGERARAVIPQLEAALMRVFSSELPVLHPSGPTFVGVFLAQVGTRATTNEIKVDGSDWPIDLVNRLDWTPGDTYASVRQLAVLVPDGPRTDWPAAATVQRSLQRLPHSEGGQ